MARFFFRICRSPARPLVRSSARSVPFHGFCSLFLFFYWFLYIFYLVFYIRHPFFRVYRAIRSFSERSVKQSSFLGRSFRVYRAIHSFSEQSVILSSLLRRLRSLALFLDNTYTLAFRS